MTTNDGELDALRLVAHEARKVMHTVVDGYREDIDFRPLGAALEAVDHIDSRPPCPRCGKPMHKVATPIEPGDDSWVWGHDC